MNLEKFTERSRGFLQAAQTIAMRESHQRMGPEHLLKALMDDDQGLASNLIKRAGGEPLRVAEAATRAERHRPGDEHPYGGTKRPCFRRRERHVRSSLGHSSGKSSRFSSSRSPRATRSSTVRTTAASSSGSNGFTT